MNPQKNKARPKRPQFFLPGLLKVALLPGHWCAWNRRRVDPPFRRYPARLKTRSLPSGCNTPAWRRLSRRASSEAAVRTRNPCIAAAASSEAVSDKLCANAARCSPSDQRKWYCTGTPAVWTANNSLAVLRPARANVSPASMDGSVFSGRQDKALSLSQQYKRRHVRYNFCSTVKLVTTLPLPPNAAKLRALPLRARSHCLCQDALQKRPPKMKLCRRRMCSADAATRPLLLP